MKQRTQRNKRKISGQILQGRKNCQVEFVKPVEKGHWRKSET